MKIGSFRAIVYPLSGSLSHQGRRTDRIDRVGRQLGQRHAIEHHADARLNLLHRAPQIAARELRAVILFRHAAHDSERPLEGPDHLPDRDISRFPRQYVATLGTVMARDEPLLRQALEDLGQALGRNVKLLGDALGAHHPFIAMGRDEVHRHQSVVGPLGESEHLFEFDLAGRVHSGRLPLYPTLRVADPYSRSLPPTPSPVNWNMRFHDNLAAYDPCGQASRSVFAASSGGISLI